MNRRLIQSKLWYLILLKVNTVEPVGVDTIWETEISISHGRYQVKVRRRVGQGAGGSVTAEGAKRQWGADMLGTEVVPTPFLISLQSHVNVVPLYCIPNRSRLKP